MEFQPTLRRWFDRTLGQPTPVQRHAWPLIAEGDSVLISAPTGSGKTLAAWLPLLERMLQTPGAGGVRLLYITPLRALSRDMVANLSRPLEVLEEEGVAPLPRIGLRTGDTSPVERRRMRENPPEILVTTPESLFLLLGSAGGRRMLETVETVLIDEIHALAGSKRGAHLALSLEWLESVNRRRLQRIGISATQRPLETTARFLCGDRAGCRIVSVASEHPPEIELELPQRPLGAYADLTHWGEIHARLAELSQQCRSMLVFCNTRALVERTARALAGLLGDADVAAHHGSLGQQRRLAVEQGLKHGRLRVVVSSASLELGLDIGRVDVVCQLGSPGRINVLRQRAGRARHRPGSVPLAHLFPLNLSDLLEAEALIAAVTEGELDHSTVPPGPADVLCQHLVAMVGQGMASPDELYALVLRAGPWGELERSEFDRVVDMLCDGFVSGRESARALIQRSADGRRLLPGSEAARIALMNAGTIPEMFEYRVVDTHDRRVLGSLDQEFAFESSPGQIMQLGNQILRIDRIGVDTVWAEAAPDETPNIPFWFGDAPGRSDVLSSWVQRVMNADGLSSVSLEKGGNQLRKYLAESRRLLGTLPGPDRIVLERFFDPGGDQHLVIHAPVGARINRAWGLALRKRFCRKFNFELQAAATENAVLISLGATHSFELTDVVGYLKSATVRDVLTQALLDTPLYQTRFRWCANTALAIRRRDARGRVQAQIQRNQTENLIARVFPDQLACLENIAGEREIPDHPLVRQALADCLEDYMDAAGLERLLAGIESGGISVAAADTPAPSPLAEAVILAPRYAHLDPADAEERRTRTFEGARTGAAPVSERGRLQELRQRAWPCAGGRREFERALMQAGYLTAREGETGVSAAGAIATGNWVTAFQALLRERAAVSFYPDKGRCLWCAVDALPELLSIWPRARLGPPLPKGLIPERRLECDEALMRLMLKRVRVLGAVSVAALSRETGLRGGEIERTVRSLEAEGVLMSVEEGCWAHREALT